jgi:transposase
VLGRDMSADREPLPSDLVAAHAMILAERAARLEAEARARNAEAEVSGVRLEIERLRLLLARMRRERFGQSSERGARLIEQLGLQLAELEEGVAEEQAAAEVGAPTPERTERSSHTRKPARRPLPENLPRERIVYPAPCTCPKCGGPVRKLGEDVTETLECEPRRWKVVEHVREKVSCRSCEAVSQPPAPSHPIARGRAGPHLLALVLAAKYGQHLPLTRQSAIYAREGIEIDVSTMADWVGAAVATLMPLVEVVRAHVFAAERLHGDDTTVPVLAKERTRIGRLWVYVRDDRPFAGPAPPAAAFFYSPDREGIHPERHLAGFTGLLQADAYAGFNRLYEPGRPPGPILEAACWAQTIRTQSGIGRHGGAGWAIGGVGIAQRDDMADFQRVFVDDDALDDELQDSLAVAEVGILEPRADPFAERGHVRQHGMSTNALFDQAAALVALLDGGAMLFGNRPTPLSQLLEADHFSLVSLEQPLVGPCQAVEPGLELTRHRLILWAPVRRLGNKALELGDQPLRVAEQADDVVPHRLLDHLGIDHRPRAFGVAPGRQRIDAGAAVVATLNPASRPSKAAAVDGEPTDATLQQAA